MADQDDGKDRWRQRAAEMVDCEWWVRGATGTCLHVARQGAWRDLGV